MDDSLTGLVVLGAFIALNAASKMAYVALINANRATLRDLAEDGNKRAYDALALANDATRLLASQQLIDLLLRFAIALVTAIVLIPPLRDALLDLELSATLANVISYGGVLLVVALFTLIFGEMLPGTIALGHATKLALWSVGPINFLSHVLAPALRAMQWVSYRFAAPFVERRAASLVTEEEIKMMVDAGSEGGAIEDEEKEMIYSIFQFGDTLTREVMVPRIDVVALDIRTPLQEAVNVIVEAGHSRIPVYEESIDHIRGLLYAKDILAAWRDGQLDRPVGEMLRPAYFVPESKKAGDLLTDLQQRKIHLAIVVDEYGGTAGLVTLEDLIEEIVGEIRDEYDVNEEEIYEKIDEHEYIFDAGIDLDDLNRLLVVNLPTDEGDTLGGYVFSKLGRVPLIGEVIETEHLRIEILDVDDRRIRKIRVTVEPETIPPEVQDARDEIAAAPD
ncbi:MAG: HlyC/CorC family transporter [Chloroflexi bacterium]|nr:HlyC/CorC family transporter [Chloroflexota bacterium]